MESEQRLLWDGHSDTNLQLQKSCDRQAYWETISKILRGRYRVWNRSRVRCRSLVGGNCGHLGRAMVGALRCHVTALMAIEATPNTRQLSSLIGREFRILAIGFHLNGGGAMTRGRARQVKHRIINHSASGCRGGGLPRLHEGLVHPNRILLMFVEGHVGVEEHEGDQSDPNWILQTRLVCASNEGIGAGLISEHECLIEQIVVDLNRGLLCDAVTHEAIHGLIGLVGVHELSLEHHDKVVPIVEIGWDGNCLVPTEHLISPGSHVSLQELQGPAHFCLRVREWRDHNVIDTLLNEVMGSSR